MLSWPNQRKFSENQNLIKKMDSWPNCRALKSWLCHKCLNISREHSVSDKIWTEWTNYICSLPGVHLLITRIRLCLLGCSLCEMFRWLLWHTPAPPFCPVRQELTALKRSARQEQCSNCCEDDSFHLDDLSPVSQMYKIRKYGFTSVHVLAPNGNLVPSGQVCSPVCSADRKLARVLCRERVWQHSCFSAHDSGWASEHVKLAPEKVT